MLKKLLTEKNTWEEKKKITFKVSAEKSGTQMKWKVWKVGE